MVPCQTNTGILRYYHFSGQNLRKIQGHSWRNLSLQPNYSKSREGSTSHFLKEIETTLSRCESFLSCYLRASEVLRWTAVGIRGWRPTSIRSGSLLRIDLDTGGISFASFFNFEHGKNSPVPIELTDFEKSWSKGSFGHQFFWARFTPNSLYGRITLERRLYESLL